MMLPTHLVFGVVLATAVTAVFPAFGDVALAAALMGSILPDLDLVFLHRRTLHFPVYASIAAIPAIGAALFYPVPVTVFVAVFLLGAAIHAVSDVFGGDLGVRPWKKNDDRGVYLHYGNRWIPPKRWIPYDGSPHDFVLLLVLTVPLLYHYNWGVQLPLLVNCGVAFVYVLVRKKLPDLAPSRFK